jgi:hypothetical protein
MSSNSDVKNQYKGSGRDESRGPSRQRDSGPHRERGAATITIAVTGDWPWNRLHKLRVDLHTLMQQHTSSPYYDINVTKREAS